MKQNITQEQLRDFWKSYNNNPKVIKPRCWLDGKEPEDINIGAMIEFLSNQEDIGNNWEWFLRENSGFPDNQVLNPKILCDALWNAVQEILEKAKQI